MTRRRPPNPNAPYYLMLQEAERRIISSALADSASISEASERLGISRRWIQIRCHALDIPLTMSAATRERIDRDIAEGKLRRRTPRPWTPKKPRTEAQMAATLANFGHRDPIESPSEPVTPEQPEDLSDPEKQ